VEAEATHPLLTKLEYRNYAFDEEIAEPLFGLGAEDTISLIHTILDSQRVDWNLVNKIFTGEHNLANLEVQLLPRRPSDSAAFRGFELEKSYLLSHDIPALIFTEHPEDGRHPLLLLKV